MLGNKNVIADIAVKDLNASRSFYEETLGLKPEFYEGEEAITYRSGDSMVNVYHSQYAATNRATSATWVVGNDLEKLVTELKSKGVHFEHYDLPDTRLEGDIHVSGDLKVAWFKDPDGNILCMVNR